MRGTVDMQAHGRVEEINEHQANVTILGDISQARKNSVAPIFRVSKRLVIKNKNETCLSEPRRTVAISVRVGSCNKHHLLPTNELHHLSGDSVAHLAFMEPLRTFLALLSELHLALTRSSVIYVRPMKDVAIDVAVPFRTDALFRPCEQAEDSRRSNCIHSRLVCHTPSAPSICFSGLCIGRTPHSYDRMAQQLVLLLLLCKPVREKYLGTHAIFVCDWSGYSFYC